MLDVDKQCAQDRLLDEPSALDVDEQRAPDRLRDESFPGQILHCRINLAHSSNEKGPPEGQPFVHLERETRFELATSTLARSKGLP